ncbi:MAG: hypothetical protein R3B41_01980 [Candidatus Doudnabacteria bacterium]
MANEYFNSSYGGHNLDIKTTSQENQLEKSSELKELLDTVDSVIEAHLEHAYKNDEGQEALIFKLDLSAHFGSLSDEEKKQIEPYLGKTKNLKILKVTDPDKAKNEFLWQSKAYELYQNLPDEKKLEYAAIPHPWLYHTVEINDDLKNKLNKQNANLSGNHASVILMEWVDGDDLLEVLYKKYLVQQTSANLGDLEKHGIQSLLVKVATSLQEQHNLDFDSLSVLQQYRVLLKFLKTKGQVLINKNQVQQIKNTLQLLHENKIFHNDLHLRNYMIDSDTGQVELIDFARGGESRANHENNVTDEFLLNLLYEFNSEDEAGSRFLDDINRDIEKIIKKDSDLNSLVTKYVETPKDQLVHLLQQDLRSAYHDSWQIKRLMAAIQLIESEDVSLANLIKQNIALNKELLSIESKKIVLSYYKI